MRSLRAHVRKLARQQFAEGYGWEDVWISFIEDPGFPVSDVDASTALIAILDTWREYHQLDLSRVA